MDMRRLTSPEILARRVAVPRNRREYPVRDRDDIYAELFPSQSATVKPSRLRR